MCCHYTFAIYFCIDTSEKNDQDQDLLLLIYLLLHYNQGFFCCRDVAVCKLQPSATIKFISSDLIYSRYCFVIYDENIFKYQPLTCRDLNLSPV